MTFKKSVACLTHPPPFRAEQPKLCPQAPQNRCPGFRPAHRLYAWAGREERWVCGTLNTLESLELLLGPKCTIHNMS